MQHLQPTLLQAHKSQMLHSLQEPQLKLTQLHSQRWKSYRLGQSLQALMSQWLNWQHQHPITPQNSHQISSSARTMPTVRLKQKQVILMTMMNCLLSLAKACGPACVQKHMHNSHTSHHPQAVETIKYQALTTRTHRQHGCPMLQVPLPELPYHSFRTVCACHFIYVTFMQSVHVAMHTSHMYISHIRQMPIMQSHCIRGHHAAAAAACSCIYCSFHRVKMLWQQLQAAQECTRNLCTEHAKKVTAEHARRRMQAICIDLLDPVLRAYNNPTGAVTTSRVQ